MANKVKRQHYVPRFYLSRFLKENENMLHVYNGEKHYRSLPERTAFQNDYYTIDGFEVEDIYAIENLFASIESQASEAFRVIDSCEELTTELKEKLSIFIGVLSTRVPSRREQIKTSMQYKLKHFYNAMLASDSFFEKAAATNPNLQDTPEIREIIRNTQIEVEDWATLPFVLYGEEVGKYICKMNWTIFSNDTNMDLVTSDNPVTVVRINEDHYGDGVGCNDAVLIFPLDNKKLLVASWGGNNKPYRKLDRRMIIKINKETIMRNYKNIYASDNYNNIQLLTKKYKTYQMSSLTETFGPFLWTRLKLVENLADGTKRIIPMRERLNRNDLLSLIGQK